jgi:hypothetical protein
MMVKVLAQRAGVEVERWRFARQRFIGCSTDQTAQFGIRLGQIACLVIMPIGQLGGLQLRHHCIGGLGTSRGNLGLHRGGQQPVLPIQFVKQR